MSTEAAPAKSPVDRVIGDLGGPTVTGERFGKTPQAVCNWSNRGRIPSTLFFRVNAALKAAGKPPAPRELFGMETEEQMS